MPALTVDRIENAFLPAREITDPARFAGRARQIEQAYLALLAEGANIAIVGNRGIGKSSLARQLLAISTGNSELLSRYSIKTGKPLDYHTFYLACGNDIETVDELLTRLIGSHDGLASWIYHVPEAKKLIESYAPKFSAGFPGIANIELGGTKSTSTDSKAVSLEPNVATIFTNICSSLARVKAARNGLLFVIDEFDQIKDPSGFASLLKSLATNVPDVRFCVAGMPSTDALKNSTSAGSAFREQTERNWKLFGSDASYV